MSGPFVKLCELLGGAVGKKLGRVVTGDLKQFEQLPGWTHAHKIEELATDRNLSASYLNELIKDSSSKAHLQAIESYLKSERKAGHMSPEAMDRYLLKVKAKVETLQGQDIDLLQVLKSAVKEKGATSFNALTDYIDHFV